MTDLERELARKLLQVDSDQQELRQSANLWDAERAELLQELRQSANRWDTERAELQREIDELSKDRFRQQGIADNMSVKAEAMSALRDEALTALDNALSSRDNVMRHVEALESVIQFGTRPKCGESGHTYAMTGTKVCLWCEKGAEE